MTNHTKARIDKTQQNSLCGDRHETINTIISECIKLAQKEYMTRHNWVGKVIHVELCKKLKFDHTNKWYMHNLAFVLENDMDKLLWDLRYKHIISARRTDLKRNNKKEKTCRILDFVVPTDHRLNWNNSKRGISSSTLQGNRKNCGTCKWRLYQSGLVLCTKRYNYVDFARELKI